LFYADDIVLTSTNLADLKSALQRIKEYLLLRNLIVEIERVTAFTYLEIVFQPSGLSFNRHVEKRMRAAIFTTYNIRELNNLSIETAVKLFELKIAPIASYGIEIIWPHLTKHDLQVRKN
jgi:hypothetical protein